VVQLDLDDGQGDKLGELPGPCHALRNLLQVFLVPKGIYYKSPNIGEHKLQWSCGLTQTENKVAGVHWHEGRHHKWTHQNLIRNMKYYWI
jgi:hypothetical protein